MVDGCGRNVYHCVLRRLRTIFVVVLSLLLAVGGCFPRYSLALYIRSIACAPADLAVILIGLRFWVLLASMTVFDTSQFYFLLRFHVELVLIISLICFSFND